MQWLILLIPVVILVGGLVPFLIRQKELEEIKEEHKKLRKRAMEVLFEDRKIKQKEEGL